MQLGTTCSWGGCELRDAAVAAGYAPRSAYTRGHILAKQLEDEIKSRRSTAMKLAGVSPVDAYKALGRAMADDHRQVRASQVRASEIVLKASRELGPDIEITQQTFAAR